MKSCHLQDTGWLKLEIIMSGEISQTQNDKYHTFLSHVESKERKKYMKIKEGLLGM
jgi:translation initiation factor IF-1